MVRRDWRSSLLSAAGCRPYNDRFIPWQQIRNSSVQRCSHPSASVGKRFPPYLLAVTCMICLVSCRACRNLKRRKESKERSIDNLGQDEKTDNEPVCYFENNFPDESVNLSSDELSPDSDESFCLGQINMTVWIGPLIVSTNNSSVYAANTISDN